MTQQRSVTCHMGSHSVTFYPTQVNAPRLHPSQTGWYSIYRPFKGGGLSQPMKIVYTVMMIGVTYAQETCIRNLHLQLRSFRCYSFWYKYIEH